jgi:hypothetical protein
VRVAQQQHCRQLFSSSGSSSGSSGSSGGSGSSGPCPADVGSAETAARLVPAAHHGPAHIHAHSGNTRAALYSHSPLARAPLLNSWQTISRIRNHWRSSNNRRKVCGKRRDGGGGQYEQCGQRTEQQQHSRTRSRHSPKSLFDQKMQNDCGNCNCGQLRRSVQHTCHLHLFPEKKKKRIVD